MTFSVDKRGPEDGAFANRLSATLTYVCSDSAVDVGFYRSRRRGVNEPECQAAILGTQKEPRGSLDWSFLNRSRLMIRIQPVEDKRESLLNEVVVPACHRLWSLADNVGPYSLCEVRVSRKFRIKITIIVSINSLRLSDVRDFAGR